MKKVSFLLLMVFFLSVTVHAQKNLIPNGDMSDWKKGKEIPEGYKVDSIPKSTIYFSLAKEKFEGKNAVQMTYSNKGQGGARYISTPYVDLIPGKYELTFYLKGSGFLRSVNLCTKEVTNDQRRSRAESTLDKLTKLPMGKTVKAQDMEEWKKYTVQYTVTKEGEYNVNFAHNNREGNVENPLLMADISLIRK